VTSRTKSDENNPLVALDLSEFHKIRWPDVLIRFLFGLTISVVAGVVGVTCGVRIGGILLAFPAILPATLTLIAKEEGEERSFHDLQGTVCGACGLVGFGVVAALTIGRVNVLLALALALLAWCAIAGTLYLVWATWLRRLGVKL
jgi:uncharacterized membrane protein (GlpM family)